MRPPGPSGTGPALSAPSPEPATAATGRAARVAVGGATRGRRPGPRRLGGTSRRGRLGSGPGGGRRRTIGRRLGGGATCRPPGAGCVATGRVTAHGIVHRAPSCRQGRPKANGAASGPTNGAVRPAPVGPGRQYLVLEPPASIAPYVNRTRGNRRIGDHGLGHRRDSGGERIRGGPPLPEPVDRRRHPGRPREVAQPPDREGQEDRGRAGRGPGQGDRHLRPGRPEGRRPGHRVGGGGPGREEGALQRARPDHRRPHRSWPPTPRPFR